MSAGTCTISADQAGDAAFLAAAQVVVSFAVTAVAPGAPTIGAVTAGYARASVAFSAPASTGGSAVTSYTVTSTVGSYTATGSSSPVIVTLPTTSNPLNATAYYFTVTATNSAGTSARSSLSASVTPYTVPTDATTVAGTAGSTTVALTWVAPLFTGGRAVDGYSVQVSTSPGGPYADAVGCTGATTSTGRSCTATGLTNGTAYYFKVAAINIAGTGPYSIESAPVTPAAPS